MNEPLEVAIIMPAYNASHYLRRSLPAALTAARGGPVVVVDPGSTDETAAVARELGARVISLGHRAGPALARNLGVRHVDSDVVLFIDADCVAHPDVVERVAAAFATDCELVSLTGSYDATPPEPNFFSQYMNLRHHLTHQRANTERAGFWAGCGAVLRSAFERSGGFDADRYPAPMIEDIELGLRLSRLGRCRLDPALQVTHLKRWSLRAVIETDIRCRALPWSKLITETGELPDDLNLRVGQRIAAALAPIVLIAPLAVPLCLALGAWFPGALLLAGCGVSVALHWDVLRGLWRLRGLGFALRYYAFQQVHLTYSAGTFGVVQLWSRLSRRSRRAVAAG